MTTNKRRLALSMLVLLLLCSACLKLRAAQAAQTASNFYQGVEHLLSGEAQSSTGISLEHYLLNDVEVQRRSEFSTTPAAALKNRARARCHTGFYEEVEGPNFLSFCLTPEGGLLSSPFLGFLLEIEEVKEFGERSKSVSTRLHLSPQILASRKATPRWGYTGFDEELLSIARLTQSQGRRTLRDQVAIYRAAKNEAELRQDFLQHLPQCVTLLKQARGGVLLRDRCSLPALFQVSFASCADKNEVPSKDCSTATVLRR